MAPACVSFSIKTFVKRALNSTGKDVVARSVSSDKGTRANSAL